MLENCLLKNEDPFYKHSIIIDKKFFKNPNVVFKKNIALDKLKELNDSNIKLFSFDHKTTDGKIVKGFRLTDYKELYNYVKKGNKQEYNYYENFEKNELIKLFVDIDTYVDVKSVLVQVMNKTNIDEESEEQKIEIKKKAYNKVSKKVNTSLYFKNLCDEITDKINEHLEKKFKVNKSDIEIIYLKSNDYINFHECNLKISGHIIFNNIHFENVYIINDFFNSFDNLDYIKKIIDNSVYKVGSFRLLNCSKKGKNNVLKYFDYIETKYEFVDDEKLFYDSLLKNINDKSILIKEEEIDKNLNKFVLNEKKKKKELNSNSEIKIIGKNYCYIINDLYLDYFINKIVNKIPLEILNNYVSWCNHSAAFKDLYDNVCDIKYREIVYKIWDDWSKKSNSKYDKDNNRVIFSKLNYDRITIDYLYNRYEDLDEEEEKQEEQKENNIIIKNDNQENNDENNNEDNIVIINNNDKEENKKVEQDENIKIPPKKKSMRFRKIMRFDVFNINLDKINKENITEVNEQYIDKKILLKLNKNKILFLKSPCGSGKTHIIFSYLEKIRKEKNNRAILSITSRTNLALKHCHDYKLKNYDDYRHLSILNMKELAVCLNSIIKLDSKKYKDCILILDEFSKILQLLSSNLLSEYRNAVCMKLFEIIRNSKKVIIMDADLLNFMMDFILSINNNEDKYHLYINKYQNRKDINAIFYQDKNVIIEKIINDSLNNVHFISSFDSLKMMDYVILEMTNKKNKLINKINKKTDTKERRFNERELNKEKTHNKRREKKLLKGEDIGEFKKKEFNREEYEKQINNISKIIQIYSSRRSSIDMKDWNVNSIIFSPVIVYGLDFNPNEKTKVYCFNFRNILNAFDLNQQINRCRNQSEVHIYCESDCVKSRYFSMNSFTKQLNQKKIIYEDTLELIKINFPEFQDEYIEVEDGYFELNNNYKKNKFYQEIRDSYNTMYKNFLYMDTIFKSYSEYYLKEIMKTMGYKIIDNNDKTKFKMKKKVKMLKEKNNEIYEDIILNNEKKQIINNQVHKFFNEDININKYNSNIENKLVNFNIYSLDDYRDLNEKTKEYIKNIVNDNKKYENFLNLKRYYYYNKGKNLLKNNLNNFVENSIESAENKIHNYVTISKILDIDLENINYDNDKNKFDNKLVLDDKMKNNINIILSHFNIKKQNKLMLNVKGGYKILYDLFIIITKKLFGNDILNIKREDKIVNGQRIQKFIYSSNKDFLKKNKYFI